MMYYTDLSLVKAIQIRHNLYRAVMNGIKLLLNPNLKPNPWRSEQVEQSIHTEFRHQSRSKIDAKAKMTADAATKSKK